MSETQHNELRKLCFSGAIREGIDQAMQEFPDLVVIGEGVPDPKAIFNTTAGLSEKYGNGRVFDMPLAENGMTGVCIGAALDGVRVLMIHQRIDFVLLAMDQIVNNAAKWHYMFDGQSCVPIVIRMIIGRGWGQGPQHSQSLHALFAHIPGLKVVMPTTARDAKGMMIAALQDNNPVIFIEHRWLHHIEDHVPEQHYICNLNKASIIRKGKDLTVVACSLMVIETIKAANVLAEFGIDIEIIDLKSIRPLDIKTIIASVEKTKNLVVADTAWKTGGIAGEIVTQVVEQRFDLLERAPLRIASPDHPVPTSHHMADHYYQDALQIAGHIMDYLQFKGDTDEVKKKLITDDPLDIPHRGFQMPF